MGSLLVALLCAAPVADDTASSSPPVRMVTLRTKIDFGGMIASYWYLPQSRTNIDAAIDNARGVLAGEEQFNGRAILLAVPVVGPWTAALKDGPMEAPERALLCATGMLQALGLTLGALRLFTPGDGVKTKGAVMSISPISAGRLGIGVKIYGF